MPLSVRSRARYPVPQKSPTPRHSVIVAIRDPYGVLPKQSAHPAEKFIALIISKAHYTGNNTAEASICKMQL